MLDKSGDGLWSAFNALPPVGGGQCSARLLTDNALAWSGRWALLAGARRTIHAAYFILEQDVFGFAFLGHLLRKQMSGVTVRLMIDAAADLSGRAGFKAHHSGGKDFLQELVHHGAAIRIYHPAWQRPFKLPSMKMLASNHDKLLVVDGERAITGGRNISRHYLVAQEDFLDEPGLAPGVAGTRRYTDHAWRDTDVELTGGEVASALIAAFNIEFTRGPVTSEVDPDAHNYLRRERELIGAYCLMDIALQGGRPAAGRSREAVADELLARALARLPGEGISGTATAAETQHLQRLALELAGYPSIWGGARRWREACAGAVPAHECRAKVVDQTAQSGGRVNHLRSALADLVGAARQSVEIENPYVVPTEEMLGTLQAASRRGVAIRIGTNSPVSTDSPITQGFFLADWKYILARLPTARLFVATGEVRLHAKVATIDDEVTVVSTYNLDFLSGFVNGELGVVIWSRAFNRATRAAFQRDFGPGVAPVEEYRIRRDAAGRPVTSWGRLVAEHGPAQHLARKVRVKYFFWRLLCLLLRRTHMLRSLRRRSLAEVAGET